MPMPRITTHGPQAYPECPQVVFGDVAAPALQKAQPILIFIGLAFTFPQPTSNRKGKQPTGGPRLEARHSEDMCVKQCFPGVLSSAHAVFISRNFAAVEICTSICYAISTTDPRKPSPEHGQIWNQIVAAPGGRNKNPSISTLRCLDLR